MLLILVDFMGSLSDKGCGLLLGKPAMLRSGTSLCLKTSSVKRAYLNATT